MHAAGRRHRLRRLPPWLARCLQAAASVALAASPLGTVPMSLAGWPGQDVAAPVLGGTSTLIAAGDNHTCLLRSGAVSCWGADDRGQLGDGGSTDRPYLTPVHLGRVTGIAAGGDRTCALVTGGGVYCWGAGDGATPVRVSTGAVPVAGIAVGASVTCALSQGGTVSCWAQGSPPVLVDLAGQGAAQLSAGGSGVCALTTGGTVYCWAGMSRAAPVDLGGVPVAQVDTGDDHACALSRADVAYCWSDTSPPVAVPAPARFTTLAAGYGQTCALAATGVAYCWAAGGAPVAVTVPAGVRFSQLDAGAGHACGLARSGTAYCWGANARGQLGDRSTTDRAAAVPVRTAPDPPIRVTGTGGNGFIDVSWVAPAASGRVTGYVATAEPGGGTCRSARAPHCRITGLANGTAYTLTVTALASDGSVTTSPPSAPVSPHVLPGRPADPHAEPGDGSLAVTWSPPVSLGTGGLRGYGAIASPGGATCTATATAGTSCTITGLANGTTYTVTVIAVTEAGASAPSNPSNAATPGAPELPDAVPAADAALGSSAGSTFPGTARTTTLTGAGFAPGTPVVVGLYPGARQLMLTTSDGSGNLTGDLDLPAELRGGYRLVVRGYAPGGGTRTLTMFLTLGGPAAAGGQLMTAATAMGVVLFAGGLVLLVLGLRGRRTGQRAAVSADSRMARPRVSTSGGVTRGGRKRSTLP